MESTSASATGLAQVMEAQGRRTGWVAEKLGVTPSAVSRWASGEWTIPERRVRELAQLLAVPEFQIRNSVPLGQQNGPSEASGQAGASRDTSPEAVATPAPEAPETAPVASTAEVA